MCTLTFVPLSQGFFFCSNRDERLSRAHTLPPAWYASGDLRLCYPRDVESTGTWIASSSKGLTFCLLNGAFDAHVPAPPYRKSRGLVLLEILKAGGAEKFLEDESLIGIEPFTLVMLRDDQSFLQLQEMRWDGSNASIKNCDARRPQIWSSSTLYSSEVRKQRECWFEDWCLQHPEPTQEDLLKFHHFGGIGDRQNDLLMNRKNDRQTISITFVCSQEGQKTMFYRNLVSATDHEIQIG